MENQLAYSEEEKEFLLKEYEESFANVISIERELFNLGKYVLTIVVSLVSLYVAVINMKMFENGSEYLFYVLSLFVFVVAFYADKINKNKSESLWRYRNRINVLRYGFIGKSENKFIKAYVDEGERFSVRVIDPEVKESNISTKLKIGNTIEILYKNKNAPAINQFNNLIIKTIMMISVMSVILKKINL